MLFGRDEQYLAAAVLGADRQREADLGFGPKLKFWLAQ